MAEVMLQLALDPGMRERCAREIGQPAPAGLLTIERLEQLHISNCVVLETKRYVPLVPVAFGRAQRAVECEGYTVPENWTVYLALWLNNRDPAIYTNPDKFDPDRFSPQRAEHRHHPMAFIPQGAEPPTGHRCLGLDYSTYLTLMFLTLLVRDYDWTLPPQALKTNWKMLPPEPRDGMRMTLRRRDAA